MGPIAFNIFPAFQSRVSEVLVKKRLELVSKVINFSQGEFLHYNKIDLLKTKLREKLKDSTLYPGGSSVLFGWAFPCKHIGSIMFKPYYARELAHLIIHYLSIEDFFSALKNIDLKSTLGEYIVTVPQVIGLATIEILDRKFPVLIVEEIKGESLKNNPSLIKCVSRVAVKLAQEGIICDPYTANWLSYTREDKIKIAYIDLLSSNILTDVNEKILELISSLE